MPVWLAAFSLTTLTRDNTSMTHIDLTHCSRRGFVHTLSAATLFPWVSAHAQDAGGVLKLG